MKMEKLIDLFKQPKIYGLLIIGIVVEYLLNVVLYQDTYIYLLDSILLLLVIISYILYKKFEKKKG